ncbi:MAG: phenylacetate--CoA ligase [Candidatus Rokubacteria bacterium]|nr:phenylacetate--CoA ligase [Candidatus Rokubacteria bacterium]
MIWDLPVETAPRETLEALQLERLRRTLEWIRERVPFYRARLGEAGLAPSDLRSLQDLPRLPFTRKADVRDHYPFGLFAVPREQVTRIHASSGTRGKPAVVGYTRQDLEIWSEVMARGLAAAGAHPGEILHVAYGYGLFTGGLGFHYGAERLGLTVIPASSGNTLRQIMLLQDFRPRGLACTPSFALHIGEAMREAGIKAEAIGLRYGLFGAEPWSEGMRREIEAVLGLTAVDFYGLSEVIGPGVAAECAEARDGLHINEDHFLPEVVDPASGEPLPPGTEGELVFTTLSKEAFPLIRYRTGDISALYPGPCRCGRTLVRMARVKGRADDMLIIRGVNVYPSQVEAVLLEVQELAPHYQLVVDRSGTLPRLEVQVEPAESLLRAWGGWREDRPELARLRETVAARLKAALALTTEVRILPPKGVPRSEGKAVRVLEKP